jgi:hypothetical protein
MAFSVSPYPWRRSLFHVIAKNSYIVKECQLVRNNFVLINGVNIHCLQTVCSSIRSICN